jgi:ribonucleoside-diphosphate reductase alpha chain
MLNHDLWAKKYKSKEDLTPEDTFRRVARTISKGDHKLEELFFNQMSSLKFIPGGRILAYAGTGNPKATFANCYVMGEIEDSMDGIMKALHESALTLKAGGGIGLNFSTLRPEGEPVKGTASVASGPVSFMDMWNAMSKTISGANARKGAMIGVLNVDHPEIEKFIAAKAKNSPETPVLDKFNISVGITDAFMKAVAEDKEFQLVFGNKVYKTISARKLMQLIVENAWAKDEPGVLFLDNINNLNNLWYCEKIQATNPCGELPLPPYGACMLGAINLTKFIKNPFTNNADLDWDTLKETIKTGVIFLDNTIDECYYPVQQQAEQAYSKRRIGLGIMGLGSLLAMLRVRYGSPESIRWAQKIFEFIRDNAYITSIEIAREKGPFPLFDKEKYLQSKFIQRLPLDIQEQIKKYGIRNSCLMTIAPTGSISQLVGYVSSGVEPIYSLEYIRKNPEYNQEIVVEDLAWKLYKELHPDASTKEKPDYFVTAHELSWQEHIDVMAACQYYIDSSISKTINLPESITVEELQDVYFYAWKKGLKGCTIYRDGTIPGVLQTKKDEKEHHMQKLHPAKARPRELPGITYRVKSPEHKFAFYLTFTYHHENGKKRPYELFINTKSPLYEEWTKALGRLISAVFRNVDDPTFLVDELKEIMGKSGFWSPERRKFVPSIIAEIGEVMKDFFTEIGIMEPDVPIEVYAKELGNYKNNNLHYCPVCGQPALIVEEGCQRCTACDFNKCG